MCSGRDDGPLRPLGFPIRKSPDRCLVTDSPGLIAGSYVLLRLLVPRHPPCALNNLATTATDARVHCAVLKIRTVPPTKSPQTPPQAPSRHLQQGKFGGKPVLAEETSRSPFPHGPTACRATPTAP